MKNGFLTGSEILAACCEVSSLAEVSGIEREYSSVEFNPVKTVSGTGTRVGWGLRMVRNDKLGVAGQWGYVSPFELVERGIGSCRYGQNMDFSFPSDSPECPPEVPDSLSATDHDCVCDYLSDMLSGVKKLVPEASLTARIEWGTNHFFLLNSEGLRAGYTKTKASTSLSVTVPTERGLLQSRWAAETSCSLPSLSNAVEMLTLPLMFKGISPGEAVGRKKVVLSPSAFSVLLQCIRTGVSGRLLALGGSPLAGLSGEKVLSEKLTLKDMPGLSNGAASAPFDSEGVPSRDRTLFDKGVFTGFIHDLHSAHLCNTESTGSSGRNLGYHSRPVCTNLVVDPCAGSTADTLKETGSGIFVTDILSAGGGDTASGQFMFDCGRVYLFRRGEICGYYHGCVISGNVYDALSRIVTLGSRQYRTGSDLLPFVSLDGVSVR